jgi:N-acetyl-gamma-glutamylphosphate reductase
LTLKRSWWTDCPRTAGIGAELSRQPITRDRRYLVPYNVVDHRHTYEMEQELTLAAGKPVTVSLHSHLCPHKLAAFWLFVTVIYWTASTGEILAYYRSFF